MTQSPLPESHARRFEVNCSALVEVDAPLARRLESESIPAGTITATGRDGTETLLVTGSDGVSRWFGDSSMPSVSAEAMFGQFVPRGGNVLLPGIGTGREALLLVGRLPGHCAVLIHESDPAALKLAMGLHDYAELIRKRRLVFCTGSDLGPALADLFVAVPGLEFPVQMLPLPRHNAASAEQMGRTLEAAGQRVGAHQATLADSAGRRLRQHVPDATSDRPRLAVVSRDPRPEAGDLVERIVETLNGQGWPAAGCTPRRPDQCHAVARLGLLADHRPDGVLLINCLPGPLGQCLPRNLPAGSWLISADSVPAEVVASTDSGGPIFAAGTRLVEALIQAGADRRKVHLLERATDPQVFKPVTLDETQRQQFGCDVALCADAVEADAQAANITLASHIRLWEQLVRTVADGIGDWTPDSPRRALQQAQRKSGVRLGDQDLTARFERLVAHRLAPTAAVRYVAGALARSGFGVTIWGQGWSSEPAPGVSLGGAVHRADEWNRVYNGATVSVWPWLHERMVQGALDCLAAGGCPICPAPAGALEEAHPDLASVLSSVPKGGTPKQLVARAQSLARHEDQRRQAIEPAGRQVLEAHTLEQRLRTLWEMTSESPASATAAIAP
ncbi:MAG: glycosyltransferase [Phycisphaerae bacterium]